jgi:hypothetical protein
MNEERNSEEKKNAPQRVEMSGGNPQHAATQGYTTISNRGEPGRNGEIWGESGRPGYSIDSGCPKV